LYRVCDNRKVTVLWDESQNECSIGKSTPEVRCQMFLWDPRTAGLVLDRDLKERDYIEEYDLRRRVWGPTATLTRNGALCTVTFVKVDEISDARLSVTFDTEHGFTPVLYSGESLYKANSKFPGKTELHYKATAKWERVNGVWLPTHHREENRSG